MLLEINAVPRKNFALLDRKKNDSKKTYFFQEVNIMY